MGSGAGSVQPRYHIQRVGDQYELRSVGWLRSWAVRLMKGEYAASKESLGRLELMAKKLHPDKPKEAERLRGLVRSLTGMLDKCPQDQKDGVQHTLDAVRGLFPQNEGEPVSPEDAIHPKTPKEKLAIAKSIIERARSGKPAAHWPQAFLEGKTSPLTECFQEYLQQTSLTKEELAQVIEAMYMNGEDYGEALLQALKSQAKNLPSIKDAVLLFATKVLKPCMDALQNPQSKDFGELMLRARQGIELALVMGLDLNSLPQTFLILPKFFQQMFAQGLEFSTTASLTSRRFLERASTNVQELQEWAKNAPSKPLQNTFGRISAIEIGGIPQKMHVRPGVEQPDAELANAYHYNQALMGYLKKQGVANAAEVANQLMLRCTIESTSDNFLKTFGNVLLYSPENPLQFKEDDSELDAHPVIDPEKPTVRFSVDKDTGKCIIERVCPMQFESQYAWRVTRAEFDLKKIGDQWTETVSVKPYAEALADEVQRRIEEEGKTPGEAIAEIEEALKKQIPREPKRREQIDLMHRALEKKHVFYPDQQILPQTPQEKLFVAKSIVARARLKKADAPWSRAFFEGDPSPLSLCFEEYLSQPGLTEEKVVEVIEAMQENAKECWEPFLQALRRKMQEPGSLQKAALTAVLKSLSSCVATLRDKKPKDPDRAIQIGLRALELSQSTRGEIGDFTQLSLKSNREQAKQAITDFQNFVVRGFSEGLEFSKGVSHPSRPSLSVPDSEDADVAMWAKKAPSVLIRDAFGQREAIEIGGECHGVYEVVETDDQKDIQLANAYYYNQALKKYLEKKGVMHPQEVADELMFRCAEESTAPSVLSSSASLRDQGLIREATEMEKQTVIQPDRPTIRFSIEEGTGKCVIERSFPMVYERPGGAGSRQFAWCVSRVEVDPTKMEDRWTETVRTKSYGKVLAEEVERRIGEGKTRDAAIQEVQAAVREQMGEFPEAEDLVAQIRVEA